MKITLSALSSALLCSALLSSQLSVPLFAISSNPAVYDYQFSDSDSDGQDDTVEICVEAIFAYTSPDDDDYTLWQFFDTDETPELKGQNITVATGELPRSCFVGEINTTNLYRVCITNSDESAPLICDADQEVTTPAEFPPVEEPGTGQQAYPSYGAMLGTQILLIASIGIILMITRAYTPKGRR